MATLDFPSSPTVGQKYTAASGAVYTWDGAAWTLGGPITASPVGAAGGTLGGSYPNPTLAAGLQMYAILRRSANMGVSVTTITDVSFDTIEANVGGMAVASPPTSVVTVQQAGLYAITGMVGWQGGGGSVRRIAIWASNGPFMPSVSDGFFGAAWAPAYTVSAIWLLPAAATIKLQVYHDVTGGLSLIGAWNYNAAYLAVARIA